MQEYFQRLRPLDKLDEQDGVAMAEAFTLKYTKKEKHDANHSKDSKAVIRSEDLVLQLVSVRHRVEGEALRLQAWHNLQRLRLHVGEGRHYSVGVGM